MTQKIVNVSDIEGLMQKTPMIDGSIADIIHASDLRALLDKSPTLQDAMLSMIVERANEKGFGNVEISDSDKSPSVSGEAVKTATSIAMQNAPTIGDVINHHKIDLLLRVAELEAKLKVASEALENIVKHFDLMGKSITDYSITYQIATEALAKIKD